RSVHNEAAGGLIDPLHLRPQPHVDAELAKLLHEPADQIRIESRQHPLGSLEHCHVDAGPGSDVREFGGDVTATDQGDARREDVELEKLLAGDCILLAGDIQRYGARTASDQDVSPLELPVALDYDRIGAGESGAPVKGVNSAFGKFLFPIAG